MITCQHKFVEYCQAYYTEIGISPGNPLDGEWHKAHYPVPKCLGGEEWVWLLKPHHAIHGVLQSIEFQHRCIRSWEKNYLPPDYLELYFEAMKFSKDHRPSHLGTKWINNGTEQKRLFLGQEMPTGWDFGRLPVQHITNGIENKMIAKNDPIPEGWRKGRVGHNPTKGKKWINNGEINKLISPTDPIPEGWKKGILR